MDYIYMDNAATTAVEKDVFNEMAPYFTENFANPSAVYGFAYASKKAVEKARKQAAELIGAQKEEVFFTSGGSEADNWAIKGTADFFYGRKNKIVTTPIEHHAVLNTVKFLEKYGFKIEYIPVDGFGVIDLKAAEKIIDSNTALVSVMLANNEVGTIEPIKEVSKIAAQKGAYFHTDAVQAAGHIKIDVNKMGIDMLSVSGHKLGAPKGIGFLYKRNGVGIGQLIHGGRQEMGMRAGTENVPYIAALGKACQMAAQKGFENTDLAEKRDYFIKKIINTIPDAVLNGHPQNRLPSNINISFLGAEGRSIVSVLSSYGICASAQSACAAKGSSVSHVLSAMGMGYERAVSAVRFTIGENNAYEELDYVAYRLADTVKSLRNFDK